MAAFPSSPFTAQTPTMSTPSAPDGTYALSNLDRINVPNGSLSVSIPLIQIPGRGNAKTALNLYLPQQQWRVMTAPVTETNCNNGICQPQYGYFFEPGTWYTGTTDLPRYGFGMMLLRSSGANPVTNQDTLTCTFSEVLTRLTYVAPDGSETEFRDTLTGGSPQQGMYQNPPSRGTVFEAYDGSSARFISSQTVYDPLQASASCPTESGLFPYDGILQWRDGTTYRIQGGYVTQISDRNGNTVTWQLASDGVTQDITDAWGRTITVQPQVPDSFTGFFKDVITYPAGTSTQTITVHYGYLQQHFQANSQAPALPNLLRQDNTGSGAYATGSSINQLFYVACSYLINGYQGDSCAGSQPFDMLVPAWIDMPDGTSYQISYDAYGDVARIVLPTGGAYEYDHGPCLQSNSTGCTILVNGNGSPLTSPFTFSIQRTLLQKRVYSNASSSTPEQTISYSPGIQPPKTVTYADGSVETHTFNPFDSPTLAGDAYNTWPQGRETSVQYKDTDGQSVLRTAQTAYTQRPCTESTCWFLSGNGQYGYAQSVTDSSAPAHDTRVQYETTTLDDNETSEADYTYDNNNNKTDVVEYDYGPGAKGAEIRHTHTSFDTDLMDSGSPYVYILNVPQLKQVFGMVQGSETLITQTNYGKDENTLSSIGSIIEHAPGYGAMSPGAPTFDSSFTRRGNITSEAETISGLTWQASYDIAGNVVQAIDPRGVTVNYAYADSQGVNSYAFPTSITGYPVVGSTSPALSESFVYDYTIGKPSGSRDFNNNQTIYSYLTSPGNPDPFGRLTNISRPDGGQTTFVYTDTPNAFSVLTKQDQSASGDGKIQSTIFYDGVGRKAQTQVNEGSSSINTAWSYDNRGRVASETNPYRSPTDATYGVTGYAYDGINRTKAVTLPDGSVNASLYSGSLTLAIDPAQNNRQMKNDAAGRLVQAIENQTSGTAAAVA